MRFIAKSWLNSSDGTKKRSRGKFGKEGATTYAFSTTGSEDHGLILAFPFKHRLTSELASAASASSG